MRLREFFERLPKDGWWMCSGGQIRRGDPHWKKDNMCQCPITQFAGIPANHWRAVALHIGLDEKVAQRIMRAADGEFGMTAVVIRIRRLLLRHCGLSDT